MDKSDLRESNRRGGFYWLNGIPYVSVTTVLKAIDKPALRRWVGKEVYLAMVQNPSLSEMDALSAPYTKTKKAMDRGTTIHSIVESFKKTKEYIETIPPEFKEYAKAFYKWTRDNKITLLENEKTVVSEKYKFAGTTDLVVKKNNEETWVCDIKTGKDIYLEAHLQLSAYKAALEENGVKIDRMGVILLKDTGNYKFEEVDECFDAFLATKKLWEFLNKEDCIKVGYLKE